MLKLVLCFFISISLFFPKKIKSFRWITALLGVNYIHTFINAGHWHNSQAKQSKSKRQQSNHNKTTNSKEQQQRLVHSSIQLFVFKHHHHQDKRQQTKQVQSSSSNRLNAQSISAEFWWEFRWKRVNKSQRWRTQ